MRYFLPVFLFFGLFNSSASFGQCTPDANPMQRGAHPNELPAVCLDAQYEQTITIVAPIDTIVGGFSVPIDSMKMLTPTLPVGFTTLCGDVFCTAYPPSGALPARTCLELSGTTNMEFDSDTLFLPVTYYVTLFGFPTPIEDEVYVTWQSQAADTAVTVVGSTLIAQASGATYQWLDCDDGMAPILNATGPSYTVVESGNYALEVTQDGCIATSSCYAISTLGVNNILNNKRVNVFPNPTTGMLNIDLQAISEPVFIRIFNAIGALVNQETLSGNQLEKIQMALPNGVYTLELATKRGDSMRQTVLVQQ